jgi:hypothetical protein
LLFLTWENLRIAIHARGTLFVVIDGAGWES